MTDYPHTCNFCGVPYRVYSADEGTQSPDSHYHALVAENARLKALTEWRPIEEAPASGTYLVINLECEYSISEDHDRHFEWTAFEATHWMPLPELPEVTP